jgi:hypothetical protein
VSSSGHIARWDLDKTYLRTEFDTLRDLVRTAFERPDEKRTNPGASTLLREMVRAGMHVHILSGSPEQMRKRLEDKLRLDGITWDSFTLKPNLSNVLRLRFRAVRDQLGYKLPALLRSRASMVDPADKLLRESLFGDDAEADAFVYSLYGDVLAGRVAERTLLEICQRGRVYEDVSQELVGFAARILSSSSKPEDRPDPVERIFIHLERQTPPDDFRVYGERLVPFYNYLQAAFVLFEDERIRADAVLRVALELVVMHRFDGDALGRSYLDLAKRGHLRGTHIDRLRTALSEWTAREPVPSATELERMIDRLGTYADVARKQHGVLDAATPDYLRLVDKHNLRRS